MIKCSNCGAQLDNDALFCTECGTKVGPQKKICPHCGVEIDDDSIFCAECGAKLDTVTTQTVDQPQVDAPIEELKEESVVEQPVVEQQQTANQAKDTNVKTADINPASKTNSNSLKYIIGGVVCAALIVIGGWFVYDKFFGSMIDKLEILTPIKYVRIAVPSVGLYTEPNVNAPVAKDKEGDDLIFQMDRELYAIEDCGEWYKVVAPPPYAYQEVYIKKSECNEFTISDSVDMYATYLTIGYQNYGSSYIVHRSEGKQLVLLHRIVEDTEWCELGTFHEGVYVFNYSVKIDSQYWKEYRKTIITDNGSVNLIDFNQIPEERLTDPFKEVIKNHERCLDICSIYQLSFFRFRKVDISTISSFYKVDHPYLEGNIAGKYDFTMFLDIYGDRVEGRYRVLQNRDGFVSLSGSISMGRVEVYEYTKDGSQTGYYFAGTLTDKGFSGKYLSTENKKLKMSFTSKVK